MLLEAYIMIVSNGINYNCKHFILICCEIILRLKSIKISYRIYIFIAIMCANPTSLSSYNRIYTNIYKMLNYFWWHKITVETLHEKVNVPFII